MNFNCLDKESEQFLLNLVDTYQNQYKFHLEGDLSQKRIIQHLMNEGYIDGHFWLTETDAPNKSACDISLTQKAYAYREMKEKYLEEQKSSAIQTAINLSGVTIKGKIIQIGTNNSITIPDYENIANSMDEFKKLVENEAIILKQQKKLMKQIDKVNKATIKQSPNLISSALKKLWDLAVTVGAPILTSYLTIKFGLS